MPATTPHPREKRPMRSYSLVEPGKPFQVIDAPDPKPRSEEHTSELQSLMRISYAVFCLKKKNHTSIPVHCKQRILTHFKLTQHTHINTHRHTCQYLYVTLLP